MIGGDDGGDDVDEGPTYVSMSRKVGQSKLYEFWRRRFQKFLKSLEKFKVLQKRGKFMGSNIGLFNSLIETNFNQ